MHVKFSSVDLLEKLLGNQEAFEAVHMAKKAQTIEDKWRIRSDAMYRSIADYIADLVSKRVVVDFNRIDFEDFYANQAIDVMKEALKSTDRMPPVPTSAERSARMAYPKGQMPRSLKDLMALWDRWRKGGKAPPRPRKIAEKIKKAYIKKAQQVVGSFEQRIGRGELIEKREIVQAIMDRSKADQARSRTIVETETTRYWNQVRRDVYDESPDVTHYLFVAIRDMATTKWCKTRTGLVYAKGDPILTRETPPCHWNCRSELLPLTKQNPRHKALIDNDTLRRRNHSPEPLPPGWNKG